MTNLNDNRNYHYDPGSVTRRDEFLIISKVVGKGKKVIDFGCGDGSLMEILIKSGNICKGVEVSQSGLNVCRGKGLDVIKSKADRKLPFKDKSFDVAVCNVTLQMVAYPEILISEMLRISSKQIITFPNFAFILNRIELMFRGVFPKWSLFGYTWYSTGHIHQLSIKDFENYCKDKKIEVKKTYHLLPKPIRNSLQKISIISLVLNKFPNLFATMGIFETKS